LRDGSLIAAAGIVCIVAGVVGVRWVGATTSPMRLQRAKPTPEDQR